MLGLEGGGDGQGAAEEELMLVLNVKEELLEAMAFLWRVSRLAPPMR